MEGHCQPQVYQGCFSSGARRAWEGGVFPAPITGSDIRLLEAAKHAIPLFPQCGPVPEANCREPVEHPMPPLAQFETVSSPQSVSGMASRTSSHPPMISFTGMITPFSSNLSAKMYRTSRNIGFEWSTLDGHLTGNSPFLSMNQAIVNLPHEEKVYPLIVQIDGIYQNGMIEVSQSNSQVVSEPIKFYLSMDRNKIFPANTYVRIPSSGIIWSV